MDPGGSDLVPSAPQSAEEMQSWTTGQHGAVRPFRTEPAEKGQGTDFPSIMPSQKSVGRMASFSPD